MSPALTGSMSESYLRRMRRAHGFTLIEIIMVLALLGIISALGIWQMVPALEHEKVRWAASILIADLQYAQAMAARQRQPVVVIVNPSLKMYIVRDRAGATVYRERFLGEDSDYDLDDLQVAPETSVEVFPNGTATETTTFTLVIGEYERQVRLSRAGQVRMLAAPTGKK